MNGNLLRRYKPAKERQVQQKNLQQGPGLGCFPAPPPVTAGTLLQHPPMTLIRNRIDLHSAVSFI